MGYELHIIRKKDYDNDRESSSIMLEEWLEYVSADDELELTNGYKTSIPDTETDWVDDPGYCLWTAHSESKPADKVWFAFWNGVISTKYPDDATIRKMFLIANALNAKVQGDDNEFYDEHYFESKAKLASQQHPKDNAPFVKKPWWEFW